MIMETKKLKLAQGTIPSWPKGPGPQNLENLKIEFFFRLSFWFQLAMFANCQFFRFDFWQVRIWYVWTATVYIIWTVSLWVMEIIQQHGRRTEIQTSPGCWEKKPCWCQSYAVALETVFDYSFKWRFTKTTFRLLLQTPILRILAKP